MDECMDELTDQPIILAWTNAASEQGAFSRFLEAVRRPSNGSFRTALSNKMGGLVGVSSASATFDDYPAKKEK
jgi:hypothetical protein